MEFQKVTKKTVGVMFPEAIAGIMEMPSVQVLERLAQPFLTVKHEAMPGMKKKGGGE